MHSGSVPRARAHVQSFFHKENKHPGMSYICAIATEIVSHLKNERTCTQRDVQFTMRRALKTQTASRAFVHRH